MNATLITKLSLLLTAGALTVAGYAQATETQKVGTVGLIRTHDVTLGLDWFGLAGLTSWSSCPSVSGYVVLKVKDDDKGKRMMSLVTAAFLAGRQITVDIDDTFKDPNGYCYVKWLQVPN